MASNNCFTSLADIKPFKTSWKIKVKIIHTWKQFTTYTGETIEMILADVDGTLIHATIKKQQLNKFQRFIVYGEWRIIENFQLTRSAGKYRATKHTYKMSIMNSTLISKCPSLSNDFFLDLATFDDILAEDVLNEHILIDVLGQVVAVGEMKTSSQNDKPKKRLEIELRDTSDQRLQCTLWGKFADSMWEATRNGAGGSVICLLRCAKINTYNGERSVTNAFDMSLMQINSDHTAVGDFIADLPKDDLQIVFLAKESTDRILKKDKDDYINQYPMSTISDLLEATSEGKMKIMATIYNIDMEFGWYYFTCLKCKQTCYLIPKVENVTYSKPRKPLFYCKTCVQDVTKAVSRSVCTVMICLKHIMRIVFSVLSCELFLLCIFIRFKLTLDVMDNTGESKFILFDTNAYKIVNHTTTELLEGNYDEISDPKDVPLALKNLVGKTFKFLASIHTANITEGKESYKCSYVEMGDSTTNVDNIEDSEIQADPKDVISMDNQCSSRSNETRDGNGTATTTPSSKRKEDPTDQAEQSSTSKKLCLPSIKSAIESENVDVANAN
ncbi:hypothetical protein CARUB_v10006510mg, partial [Capsella rubella]